VDGFAVHAFERRVNIPALRSRFRSVEGAYHRVDGVTDTGIQP